MGASVISHEESSALMKMIPEWEIFGGRLIRTFKFKNFALALQFANKIGQLAESQGHHPLMEIGWGMVKISWWTHKIDGLHKNDFIMAAKTDIEFENFNIKESTDEQ